MTMGSTVATAPRAQGMSTSDDFDAFYRRWCGEVAAFFGAGGWVAPDDVDDLMQITFMAVVVQWAQIPSEDREPRLWAIARNKRIDYVRRDARWRQRSLPLAEMSDQPCPVGDPASVVVSLDVARHVRLAVGREKPEHQLLLNRRYVQELPYEEIAAELGKSAGALRNVMSRAHDRLRDRLISLDVRSCLSALPFLGWRWTRRSATPPWMVAAGHAAFVSLVATTMVMAPPAAVPAAAVPTNQGDASDLRDSAPEPRDRGQVPLTDRGGATQSRRRTNAHGYQGNRTSDYGRRGVRVPMPPLSLPPTTPPCVGRCSVPAETITIHLPIDNGDVSQDQNVAPICRHVPGQQSVVTCREEEGTNYAVPLPPPRSAGE